MQHRHRPQDREGADRHRNRRRQQPAEHPHQHKEAQRDRDGFHEQQVFFALTADLYIDHHLAARAHGDSVAVVHQSLGQLLGVLLRFALTAGDACDDQTGLAVLADQRRGGRRRRGPCRRHVCHVWRRLQLPGDVGADRPRCGALRAGLGPHADQELHVALPELVDQHLAGLGGLRRRVLESAGRQALGDRDAEDARGHHHQHRDDDDPLRRGDSEPSDPLQHVVSLRKTRLEAIVDNLSTVTQQGQRVTSTVITVPSHRTFSAREGGSQHAHSRLGSATWRPPNAPSKPPHH